MRYLLASLLLLASIAARGANYAPPPVVPDISSMTNRGGSLINPAIIVLGSTNTGDGLGGLFVYQANTNAVDNSIYFPSLVSTCRWVRLTYFLDAPTPVTSPIQYNSGSLSLLALTNWFTFTAGTNMQVTVTSNSVDYAMTNTTFSGSGGSALSFNGTSVTNANITNSHIVKWTGSGTNYQAYATNYFYWEGIPIWTPTLRDSVYITWTPSGTNLTAIIPAESLDPTRWEHLNWPTLMGRYSASIGDIEYITVGANLNLDSSSGVLSAVIPPGTNSWQIAVDDVLVVTPNLVDSSELNPTATGTNITYAIVSESIATNKINSTFQNLLLNQYRVNNLTNWFLSITNSATVTWATNANGDWVATATGSSGGGGSGTNAFVNNVLLQPFKLTNNMSADTGRVIWYTNAAGDVLAYATNLPAGGSGGLGTNVFVNGVLIQPAYFTNSAEVFIATNGNGHIVFDVNTWDGFWSDLTNSLVASNNISFAYDTGNNKLMISSTAAGGTGTAVTVDGGSDLTRANFADESTTGLFDISGTNITFRLPDRDFGDITVGSSGASMAINANSVALGTDTTGNYVATVAGTANKVDVSGSGSETAAVTVTLSDTIDIGSHTSFELPNSASPTTDAFGELAGDNNAWASGRGALQFFDGTANTWLVGVLSSDTPSNGQVPKWNTGGTITWEDDGGGSSGGGTNILVNGTLVNGANLTNSSTVLWSVSGTNITATVTNVAGSTTQNVVQRVGSGRFLSGVSSISNTSTEGAVTAITHRSGSGTDEMIVDVTLSARADTNYFVTFEILNSNDLTTTETVMANIGEKTTTGFAIQSIPPNAQAQPNGYWYRFWVHETVSVGGSGGDVISTNNNTFTQTNIFSGPINAATITVNDDAYAAGWNGSTNVPTKNAVYDKIESLPDYVTLSQHSIIATSPGDGVTIYVAGTNIRSTYSDASIRIPVTGTVVKYWVRVMVTGTLGTTEDVNYYLRWNDSSDFGNMVDDWDGYSEVTSGTLSQSVTAGDTIALKILCPTWATNPTNVYVLFWILIEV